jgi:hypothetical protein
MFYDFNIPYPNTSDATELERIEKILNRIQSSNVTISFQILAEATELT